MPDLQLDILTSAAIASPCTARWEDMTGDDKTRHCGQCDLLVHNFAAMTRTEVEGVLRIKLDDPAARVCARLFRRADGTIITQDCPRGLAAARVRVRRSVARIAAAFGLLFAASAAAYASGRKDWVPDRLRGAQPFAWLSSKLVPGKPKQLPPGYVELLMGDVCFTPSTPTPASSTPTAFPPGAR